MTSKTGSEFLHEISKERLEQIVKLLCCPEDINIKNQLLKELSECVSDKEVLIIARELKQIVLELFTQYSKSEGKKYKYNVSLSADDETSGYIELTKKEAEIVSYATCEDNWKNAKLNPYSGSFYIDLNHPEEVEE